MRLYDHKNQCEMRITSIIFNNDNEIARVTAMELNHTDSLRDGWWTYEGDDLKHISIVGTVEHNEHKHPKSF